MRMKLSTIKLGFEIVILIVLLVFLLIGFLRPCFLDVKVLSNSIYTGQEIVSDDVKVTSRSLFGVKRVLKDCTIENQDDDKTILVKAGILEKEFQLNKIPISYIQAEYIGRVYQYDTAILTADDFYVRTVYGDNTVDELPFSGYEIEGLPDVFTEDVTVKVVAGDNFANVTIRPIQVLSLEAVYNEGLHIGDTFDVSNATLRVRFEDGETIYDKDLSSDFSGVVTADSKITVHSDKYGDVDVQVDKSNVSTYDIKCKDKIYEGDVLTSDSFDLAAIMDNGDRISITDFEFEEMRIFEETKVEIKANGFGTLKCTIKPIAMKEIVADASVSADNKLVIRGLSMVYTDDTKKSLKMDDVTFITDLNKPISLGENTVEFKLGDHKYSFIITYLE